MWSYADGRIAKPRLRQSMRILLDRPELADLVIADLARWKDWSIQDRLMTMYQDKAFNVPAIKRAVVRYMLVCTKDVPKKGTAGPLPNVSRSHRELPPLRPVNNIIAGIRLGRRPHRRRRKLLSVVFCAFNQTRTKQLPNQMAQHRKVENRCSTIKAEMFDVASAHTPPARTSPTELRS